MGKGSGRRPPQVDAKTLESNWDRAFRRAAPPELPEPDSGEQTPEERDEGGQIIVDYDEYRRLQLENQELRRQLAEVFPGSKWADAVKANTRPPFETFKGPWCRGSYALGSACGTCDKCKWERGDRRT